MTETCQICHTRAPREGGKVCNQCMGLEREPEAGVEPELGICDECNKAFVPYKLGRGTVKDGICYDCVMKKKYGPDWIPGGHSNTLEKQRLYRQRYEQKRKLRMQQKPENGTEEAPAKEASKQKYPWVEWTEEQVDSPIPTITITFADEDEAMYQRLKDLASKERRSIDQQVMYLLDGVMGRLVV